MRIIVKGGDADINLIIPTSFLCSRIGVKFIAKYCTEKKDEQSYKKIKTMAKELNKFRKKHKGWVLIDAESDGERVLIKL